VSDQVVCVWFERIPKILRRLRRFSRDRDCPIQGPGHCSCCDAWVPLDTIPWEKDIIEVQQHPLDDPKWPTKCERCGYVFPETDHWQVFCEWMYRNTATGEEVNFRALPIGAMYDSHWIGKDMRGPDGLALTVILPDKTPWIIDGCAYPEGQAPVMHAWSRTGTPPKITASPSIQTPRYHGWLRDGVLTSC
jgi:hypothetical protein